jgi:hypothetical protein
MENKISLSTKLPYVIRAEELLNILWLSNPILDSTILVSNMSKMLTIYLDKRLPNKEMLERIDDKIEMYKELGLDEKSCVNLAMNIAELDTQRLTELINIDEQEMFKNKLVELAEEAIKLRNQRENKRDNEFGALLSYLEEEKKMEKKEAIEARENELNAMSSLYDERMRNKEKDYLTELISRDDEIIKTINREISGLQNSINRRTHRIFSFIIVSGLLGLTFIVLFKIVPRWDIFEPIIWAIGLFPIYISGFLYVIMGKNIRPKKAIENVEHFINKSFFLEMESKKTEKNIVIKRHDELLEKINFYID